MSDVSRPDAVHPEIEHIRGFVAAIEPPIDINPEVVSRVIKDGALDPNIVKGQGHPLFSEALLIGSSEERTTIYARLYSSVRSDRERHEQYQVFAHRTVELLGLLGINGFCFGFEDAPLTDTI